MKSILLVTGLLFASFSFSQNYNQYFDGADTSLSNSVLIQIDTSNANNIWQIGPPQKSIFNSASTLPNVIVTDTINHYPDSNSSSFQFWVDPFVFGWSIVAIQWTQKLDMDDSLDYGNIEFSLDNGATWQSAWNNPYVYNFYGYDQANTTFNGPDEVFTGTDTNWRDIWLCFDGSFMQWNDTLHCRFTFVSDSNTTNHEGWMIDNFMIHPTWIHTVEEIEQDEYIRLSPNPSTGKVVINTKKQNEFHIIEEIKVLDLNGRIVKEFGVHPTKTFIDISDLEDGEYILKIKTNLQSDTKKIVLKR